MAMKCDFYKTGPNSYNVVMFVDFGRNEKTFSFFLSRVYSNKGENAASLPRITIDKRAISFYHKRVFLRRCIVQKIKKILIPEADIKRRVKELGAEISRDYHGETVVLICILSGASVFFADLVRELDLDVRFEFMSVSSYGSGTVSSGEVKILKDVNHPIAGQNVIIVEDIIDSGCTLSFLKRVLEQRSPKSIRICTILDKPSRRKVDFKGDYVGFEIPDEFVIGYGLDFDSRYRNLKDVCVLEITEDE